jgi:phosphoribosylformimino-5-aminoimidazole carboxamide ribonucleotide (ProFAR) isomerase
LVPLNLLQEKTKNEPFNATNCIELVENVRKLDKTDLFDGVIIGKAIYDKSISLNELKKFV